MQAEAISRVSPAGGWRHSPVLGYTVAVLITALAALLRWALDPILDGTSQYVTFYLAVMVAAAIGGPGPGLLATALGALLGMWLFVEPRGGLPSLGTPADFTRLMVFVGIGAATSLLAGRLRASRHRAERDRELLAVTLSSIGDGVIVTDHYGHVTFLNAEAERLTGWKSAEASGQPLPGIFRIINEESRRTVESPVDKVLRLGTVVGLANHTLLIAKDGRETPIDDSGAPVREADGKVHGVVLVFRDFTERRHAEETNARLAAIVESSDDAIIAKNLDGIIQSWNAGAERLFGYRAEEIIGQSVTRLLPPERQEEEAGILRRLRAGERVDHFETVRIAKDGRRIEVSVTISPVKDHEGRIIGASKIARDISQRRRVEEALRESEQRFRTLADNISQFAWMADEKGWIFWYNRRWYDYTGTTLEEMQGWGWQQVHHPEHVQRVVEKFRRHIESGETWEDTFPLRGKDGHYRWFLSRAVPIRDEQGKVMRWFGTNTDVTEQREAQEALAQANEAKAQFLAVLSHELRTPLTPVLATASVRVGDRGLDEELREDMEMIRRNVELEARLIDDLLDITRIERGKITLDTQPVKLCTVLKRVVEICAPDLEGRQLHFGLDLKDAPYPLQADPARLQQVFWNLLKNAIKFTPHDGCIGLRCYRDNNHVVAEVADSGMGIEAEALPKVFGAFEQASRHVTRQFGGLGLGLAITKRLVELHGGSITAHSEGPGKGATFRVTLPITQAPATAPQAPPPARRQGQPPPCRLRILLVEDHGDTARVMRLLLRKRGCEVQTAGDVATALQLASTEHFDLLVSDLGLPDRSGLELMQELRQRGQDLAGIAISGFGQEEDVRKSREAGFAQHLTKPVNLEALGAAIDRAMAEQLRSNARQAAPDS